MEHFYESIPGWFDYQKLYSFIVNETTTPAHFVEIGVHKGRSAAFMAVEIANSGKQITFDCVDTWDGRGELGNKCYTNNLEEFKLAMTSVQGFYNIVQGPTPDIANRYADESLDFVFIDAEHTYDAVKADILAWLPKIKQGGYISGHDYNHRVPESAPSVGDAVKELLPDHKVLTGPDIESPSWLHQKKS